MATKSQGVVYVRVTHHVPTWPSAAEYGQVTGRSVEYHKFRKVEMFDMICTATLASIFQRESKIDCDDCRV